MVFKVNWDAERDNIFNMYVSEHKSIAAIARYYDVWEKTLSLQMDRLGIPKRQVNATSRANAQYSVDVDYFKKIDTEEKAWVLGLIASDGHISTHNNLMFCQHIDDIDYLQKVNAAMHSNYKIMTKGDKYVTLTITSKMIVDDLKSLGLNHNKSYGFDADTLVRSIPPELLRHFVRGYFDGDGSVCIYKYDYFKKHSYHFGITSCKAMHDFLKEFLGIHTASANEGNGIWTCRTTNHKTILNACHVMYDNATVYGNRKFSTFQEIERICSEEFAA